LIQKADPTPNGPRIGIDVGASLVKVATLGPDGRTGFRILPRKAIERVAREVESAQPAGVGLTGGGAAELAGLLPMDTARIDEFSAWGRGASRLLEAEGMPSRRYLLVSVGTGTSAMLVDEGKTTRVGGTALGGGTVMGLGSALAGTSRFEELVALAVAGDRRRVDLLVSEVGDVPLPGDVTASCFAKLGRNGAPSDPQDVAHALMGLVGENVALICNALAAVNEVERIVYVGGTLRANRPLADILHGLTRVLGREPLMPRDGEFGGALGALELALC
jgi:type II pantothenate kinase